MYIGLQVKYPLCLSDNNEIWIFLRDSEKILKDQIQYKFVPGEPTVLFGRTDGHNQADCHFLQFCESAKEWCAISIQALNTVNILTTVTIISHMPCGRFTQIRNNCKHEFLIQYWHFARGCYDHIYKKWVVSNMSKKSLVRIVRNLLYYLRFMLLYMQFS